jgi:hypothetical protein
VRWCGCLYMSGSGVPLVIDDFNRIGDQVGDPYHTYTALQ